MTLETNQHLLDGYFSHAAYYFYRAYGSEENILSMLERELAGRLRQQLILRCVPLPSREEIHAYAAAKFPPERLHEV